MLTRGLTGLALACILILLIEPGAARAQGLPGVHGGPWLGGYWPTGTALYTLVEPVAAEDGAERHTQAAIEQGGALIGLRGGDSHAPVAGRGAAHARSDARWRSANHERRLPSV